MAASQLAESNLVPVAFKGNQANCLIALELSHRLGVSPLAVVQNLHIIQGKPSWSSSFLIGLLNSSNRFTMLRYRTTNAADGSEQSWQAEATERETGKGLLGPVVTMAMAKAEGWLTKPGSKWQTMPQLMGRYRAAAFFARLYAPDLCLGLLTDDETRDIQPVRQQVAFVEPPMAMKRAEVVAEKPAEQPSPDVPTAEHLTRLTEAAESGLSALGKVFLAMPKPVQKALEADKNSLKVRAQQVDDEKEAQ